MKYLCTFAVLALLLVSCGKEEKKPLDRSKTDWAYYDLKGDVKTIKESGHTIVQKDSASGEAEPVSVAGHNVDREFNELGMLVSEKQLLDNGQPHEEVTYNGRDTIVERIQHIDAHTLIKTDYTRDKAGNTTTITRRNGDNTQIDRIVNNYVNGKLEEQKKFNGQNASIDRTTYNYDKNGNLKGQNIYLGSNAVQYKDVYEYDSQNRKVSEIRYNFNDEMLYKTEFRYDDAGNLGVKETTNSKGEPEYLEKFTYDKSGNLLSRSAYEKGGAVTTEDVYEYDAKNNRTAWSVYQNKNLIMKTKYRYNDKGELTDLISSDNNNKIFDNSSYTYEYDKNGNWTKKTTTKGGKPVYTEEREITYY